MDIHPFIKKKKKEFNKMIKEIEDGIDSCNQIKTGYLKNLIKYICEINQLVSKKKSKLNYKYYYKIIYVALMDISEKLYSNFDLGKLLNIKVENGIPIVQLNDKLTNMIKEFIYNKLEIEIENDYINEIIYKIFENYIENENLVIEYNSKFNQFKQKYTEEINIHKQKILSNLSRNIFTDSYDMHNNIFESVLYIFTLGASYARCSEIDLINPSEYIENVYYNIFNKQKLRFQNLILAKNIKEEEILKKEMGKKELIKFNNDLLNIVNLTKTTQQSDSTLITEMNTIDKIDLNTEKFKANQNLLNDIFKYLRKEGWKGTVDLNRDLENISLNYFRYNPIDQLKLCTWIKNISETINSSVQNTIDISEKKIRLMSLIFNSVKLSLEHYLIYFRDLTINSELQFDRRSDSNSRLNNEILKSKFENKNAFYTIDYIDADIIKLEKYWKKIDDTLKKSKDEISDYDEIIKENRLKIIEILFSGRQKRHLLKNTTLRNLYIRKSNTELLKNIAFRIKLLYLCYYDTDKLFDIFVQLPSLTYSDISRELSDSFNTLYNNFSSENLITKYNIKNEIIDWIRTNSNLLSVEIFDFNHNKFYFSMSLNFSTNDYMFDKSFFLHEKQLSMIEKDFNNIDLYTFVRLMNKLKPDPTNLINKIISEMKDIVFILGNNSIEDIRYNYAEFVCNKNYDCKTYINNNLNIDYSDKKSKIEVKSNEIIEKLYLSAYKFVILEHFNDDETLDFNRFNSVCCTISAILCHINLKVTNNILLSSRDKILIIMFYIYKLKKIKFQQTTKQLSFKPQIHYDLNNRINELSGLTPEFGNNLLKIIKGFIFIYFFDMTTDVITPESEFIETFLGVIGDMDNNDLKEHAKTVENITFNYDKFLSNNLINLFFMDENWLTYAVKEDIVYYLKNIENNEKLIKVGDHVRIITGPSPRPYGKIIDLYLTKNSIDEFSRELIIYMVEEYKPKQKDNTNPPKVYHVTREDIELEPMYKTIPYFFEDDYQYLFDSVIGAQKSNISENIEKYKGYIEMFHSIYDTINRSNETEWDDFSLEELLNDIPINHTPKIFMKYQNYNIFEKKNLNRVKINKENIDQIKSLILHEIQSLKQKLSYLIENEQEILKIRSEISNLFSNKDKWTDKDEIRIKELFEYFYGKKTYDCVLVMTEDSWGFEEEANKIEINLKKTTDISLLNEELTKAGVFKNSGHYIYRRYLNPMEVNRN